MSRPRRPAKLQLRAPFWRLRIAAAIAAVAGVLLSPPAHADAGSTPLPLKGPLPPERATPLIAQELPEALRTFNRAAAAQQSVGAEFLGHYQRFIHALDDDAPRVSDGSCAAVPMWVAYDDARGALALYNIRARQSHSAVLGLVEYNQSGYARALTPDLRLGVEQAALTWGRLEAQHRSFSLLMDAQMTSEIAELGCNPDNTVSPPRDEAWVAATPSPSEVQPSAIQVAISKPAPPPEPPPAPVEAGWGQAIAAPLPTVFNQGEGPKMIAIAEMAEHPLLSHPLAATFILDNASCDQALKVYVDGQAVGTLPGYTRSAFVTIEGPHRVCIAPTQGLHCDAGDGDINVIIYDGWAVKPGC